MQASGDPYGRPPLTEELQREARSDSSTSYKELARRMSQHAVSALPVVDLVGDEGRLVGIVSEEDLLTKKGPDPWRDTPSGYRDGGP